MKTLLFLCVLFTYRTAASQDLPSFTATDHRAENIPDRYTSSTDSLAKYISLNFNTELEKFRAIHIWTATHIRYSSDSMYIINAGADPTAKITVAFERRKGVCENYAAIFNDIANKCGITSFVVNGYTKQSGRIDRSGHSWCAVSLNGNWFFCDPTWDKDMAYDTHYFMVRPRDFIQTHIPFDPLWQLLDEPVTHAEFINGFRDKTPAQFYNYKDSLAVYLSLDEVHQLKASSLRIQKAGVVNDLIKTDVAFLKMNAEMIHEDKDALQYNSAVSDLNKATNLINDFILYRNEQFIPAKKDTDISVALVEADKLLAASRRTLKQLESSEATLQLNLDVLQEKLKRLSGKLTEQETFMARYLAGNQQERMALFYKN